MNNKNIKLLLIAAVFAAVMGIGSYFLTAPKQGSELAVNTYSDKSFGWKYPTVKFPKLGLNDQLAYSDIRDHGGIPQGLPVRLKIPVIGVDSAIEDALITNDGRMDVPQGSTNVAWFALGPNPGQAGSAVIGGHFGIRNNTPFVFYNLDKLVVGDKVYVINDKGETLAFQVREIKLFDRDADATTVFTSDDGLAHLNLITCEGLWNRVNDTYPQRRVVFTDSIKTEAISNAPAIVTFNRSLDIGAQGADVIALQTILEKKGFLTMPSGVAKGYFGSLTYDAVAKYQASVGLAPVGIFGPLTRAKLIEELKVSPIAIKASLPTTALSPTRRPLQQTVYQAVKNLYATAFDGIVTSVLLLAIGFMVFKIIVRQKTKI
ncbi:MAG: sortase [bacterium]|nr:sortase [bacterium]